MPVSPVARSLPRQTFTTPEHGDEEMSTHGSTVIVPNRRQKIRNRLSWRSSMSGVSDWSSLLDKMSRFSVSTCPNSSQCSDFLVPGIISPSKYVIKANDQHKRIVTKVLIARHVDIMAENQTLEQKCCLLLDNYGQLCRHTYARWLSVKAPFPSDWSPEAVESILKQRPIVHQPSDIYGDDVLFAAAANGVSAEILICLVNITTDVNVVNDLGQNFLFFLVPKPFYGDCCCPAWRNHPSKFGCLMEALSSRKFDFHRLDNYGRSFLSFLCPSGLFQFHWLADLMTFHHNWNELVSEMAQQRDSHGLFLIDYMAVNPRFDPNSLVGSRVLPRSWMCLDSLTCDLRRLYDEDPSGQSDLHTYIKQQYVSIAARDALPYSLRHIQGGINRYSSSGCTPIMDFLKEAHKRGTSEDVICAKVAQLLRYGANVNACSGGGSTILHFAAKKAYPSLVDDLLRSNAQRSLRDDKGHSALDYASIAFHASRSRKISRGEATSAFKSLLSIFSRTLDKDLPGKDHLTVDSLHDRLVKIKQDLATPDDNFNTSTLL
ncbi:hypothetical protein CC86DRAFT_382804 [Ophiobolus disseminans]|uniref:Uncharacterized protein n=1 Tax=Ophiobolus disseminans TaxID=1469910 RepID=A0A6A6ZY72_9PLEO|nr:hypothetical protein CC86DRAFT_382804 [Ophiobolus disseminans]